MRRHSLVELTKHDNIAADFVVHSCQRSQLQSGQITLQPVLINKSKFLKATHRTKKFAVSRLRFGLQVRSKTEIKPNFGLEECAKNRARTFRSSTEINIQHYSFEIQIYKKNHNSTATGKRLPGTTLPRSGGERSITCSAVDRSGSVAWCDGKHSSAPLL